MVVVVVVTQTNVCVCVCVCKRSDGRWARNNGPAFERAVSSLARGNGNSWSSTSSNSSHALLPPLLQKQKKIAGKHVPMVDELIEKPRPMYLLVMDKPSASKSTCQNNLMVLSSRRYLVVMVVVVLMNGC